MMYILYNILGLLAFFVLILPFCIYRLLTEKGFSTRFRQSMGLIRREEIADVMNTDCIWIHGASIGEIVATSPIVKEIKKIMPEQNKSYRKQTDISISHWTCRGWRNLLCAAFNPVFSCR